MPKDHSILEASAEPLPPHESIDYETWDFKDILRTLVHHRWFIIISVFLCVGLAVVYNHYWPKTYVAKGTVELPQNQQQTTNDAIRDLASLPTTGDPIQTYIDVAQSNTVAAHVIQKLDLLNNPQFEKYSWKKQRWNKPTEQGLENFLIGKVVSVAASKDSDILRIQASVRNNPKLAADITNAWAEGFILVNLSTSQEMAKSQYLFIHNQLQIMKEKLDRDRLIKKNYLNPSNEAQSDELIYSMLLQQDQQMQIQANADSSGIVVIDKAQVPEGHVWPNLVICAILGLFMGLLIGIQGALFLDKFQDRIKSEVDLSRATGLTQLAQIPNFRRENGKLLFSATDFLSKKHLIADDRFQFSSYRESFKVFRTNFIFSNIDQKVKTVVILSPGSGEGKTLVNADLALALAEMGKNVLLVDADLRKPTVSILFDVETSENSGLPLLLAGKGRLEDMVMQSGFEHLFLLPNGTTPPNPAELLASDTFKRVVDDMKAKFDYIVFDSAPILPVTDSVVMAAQLDGVILMGRWNQTRRSDFRRAFQQLHSVRARVLGSVLNSIEIQRGMYGYYGYSYGYGYGYGKKTADLKAENKTENKTDVTPKV
jgi:capsular exopolysaccharide synthesis family protein